MTRRDYIVPLFFFAVILGGFVGCVRHEGDRMIQDAFRPLPPPVPYLAQRFDSIVNSGESKRPIPTNLPRLPACTNFIAWIYPTNIDRTKYNWFLIQSTNGGKSWRTILWVTNDSPPFDPTNEPSGMVRLQGVPKPS